MIIIDKKKECYPCQISGAIVVSSEICKIHDLDCDEIYRAIKNNKEPEEFIDIIESLKDKADGKAKEQFEVVLDELDKSIKNINQKEDVKNG